MVSFECDSNEMLAELNNLGKLVEKVRSGIDYRSKKQPLVSVCAKGKGIEQLYCPQGVTVDNKTGNIYIADTYRTDSELEILVVQIPNSGVGQILNSE